MSSMVTISIVSAVMSGSLAAASALIGILVLLALLVQKELASVAGSRFRRLARMLNVGIAPLLIAFVLIVVSRVIEVIR